MAEKSENQKTWEQAQARANVIMTQNICVRKKKKATRFARRCCQITIVYGGKESRNHKDGVFSNRFAIHFLAILQLLFNKEIGFQFSRRRLSLFFFGAGEMMPLLCEIDISPQTKASFKQSIRGVARYFQKHKQTVRTRVLFFAYVLTADKYSSAVIRPLQIFCC